VRIKIPKSQAKVVNADEMLQLQLEAAARYYIQFVTIRDDDSPATSSLLRNGISSRKDSYASSELTQHSLDGSAQSDST
jgi:hypothetical protein